LENIRKVKVEARAEALRRIKAQQVDSIKNKQQTFDLNLSSFLKKKKGFWSAYQPISGEVSPTPSIQQNQHIRWVYPRVKEQNLEFYLNPSVWIKSSFGIEEPDPSISELYQINSLDACLVPGLAFDRQGTRLGRGFGFYDRALEGFKGLKVGLAFESQIFSEDLPRESFDISMDIIITEQNIFLMNHHPNQVIEGERRND